MKTTALALALALAAGVTGTVAAAPASAARSLTVTTEPVAVRLGATHVEVRGTLTCGGAEQVQVGVVLVQPPGSVAQDGGGTARLDCPAGATVRWAALVTAGEGSRLAVGDARFSTYASTDCDDTETDCPSASDDGVLRIRRAAGSDGMRVRPAEMRFGRQPFGSLSRRTVTITNTGTRTLDIAIESVVMPDDFSPGQPESTCPLAGVGVSVLLPGESCTHTVAFQPDPFFAQPEQALLRLTARDLAGSVLDTVRVRLSGHGY
jgi:hypothetical protein